jgi:hypothetical protein
MLPFFSDNSEMKYRFDEIPEFGVRNKLLRYNTFEFLFLIFKTSLAKEKKLLQLIDL